jgi:hypothetical protein
MALSSWAIASAAMVMAGLLSCAGGGSEQRPSVVLLYRI